MDTRSKQAKARIHREKLRPAAALKRQRADLHDGARWTVQSKTGAKLAIELTGELAQLIARINARLPRTDESLADSGR